MRLLLILFSLFWAVLAFSQSSVVLAQPWSILGKKSINKSSITTLQFQLNYQNLAKKLIHAPSRNRYKTNPLKTIVYFPLPNGAYQRFLIEEASNFHPSLAKQFPTIQAYAGTGIDDPSSSIRFSFSPKGLTGIIQSSQFGTILIDPIQKDNPSIYKVQFKKNLGNRPFSCDVKALSKRDENAKYNGRSNQIDCDLRTYRFALGCTGEYAQYHGGTIEDALIGMNNTLTVVNGIFENDMAISLELIPNTTDLIYLDGENDPYSNTELTEMLGENQDICDLKIGVDNYDIGHVFGTGLGGVAFLGVICEENFKASGATGFPQPEGPIFAIDLVAHELGHQFGAEHTFNGNQIACAGSNRNSESAVEPGSGSTIMAYAGICSPQNVQDNSDAYFHAVSIQQMREVISKSECGAISASFENTPPSILASANSFHIPISTPFALDMNVTDIGNSELTYTWEQMDAGIGAIPPIPSNEVGPMFRSIQPSNSSIRYFPNLLDLSKNISPKWEVLPSVERIMNFRGTVRDNHIGGGCYDLLDVEVHVETGIPFQVIYPNSVETWQAGTEQTILWEVGQTNESPINTQTVSILLSNDGGLTYPTILKKGVPNSGNSVILVPNMTTSTARIMIQAEENIYFDISNENFTITKPVNDFDLTVNPNLGVCYPSNAIYNINLGETGNFKEPIELKVEGLPEGVVAQFSNIEPIVPTTVTLSISNLENLNGVFDFNLIATGSTGEKTRGLSLNIASSPPLAIQLRTPLDLEKNIMAKPIFSWIKEESAEFYQLEISTDISFAQPVFIQKKIEASTIQLDLVLNNDTQYFWRVRGENTCGVGIYSEIFTFQTLNEKCEHYTARDLPITIPSIFRSTVFSTINIPENGKLTSIKLENVRISHSFIADLSVDLEAPSGESVRLVDEICFLQEDLELSFSDAADILNEAIPCPPSTQLPVQPLDKLNKLVGTEVKGDWKLIVRDNAILDGGRIENWDLNLCFETPQPLAITANKIGVSCAGGNDGMASVSPNGGSGDYTFSWSNGATSAIIQDLIAGAYSVTIFDGLISMDTTIFIEEPNPLKVTSMIPNDGCIGANNGTINLMIDGGTPDYHIDWSNGSANSNITDLSSGLYKVTVTDRIGCKVIDSTQLNISEPLSITVDSIVNPKCLAEATGSVYLNNPTNIPTFYTWSNGLTGQNQFNLPIGNYLVSALDSNGCEDSLSVNIFQEKDTIAPILLYNTPVFYLDETGNTQVDITALDAGSFDNCGGVTLSVSKTTFDCQSVGAQLIELKGVDESGNEKMAQIVLQIIDTIAPVFDCLNELNFIGCSEITMSDFPTATDNCNTVNISLVTQGETGYLADSTFLSFRAIDNAGNQSFCYVPYHRVDDFSIETNIIPPLCANAQGEASVIPISGQAPYQFFWNDEFLQTTSTASGLTEGEYMVTVIDDSGCVLSQLVEIPVVNPIELIDVEIHAEINGAANGSISLTAIGGTGLLRPVWFKGDSLVGSTFNLTNLSEGIYSLAISDENDCRFSQDFSIDFLTSTNDIPFVESIKIFPNPTSGKILVDVAIKEKRNYSIQILNVMGRNILTSHHKAVKNSNDYYNLSHLENGLYFINFIFEEGVISRKLLLTK